MPERSQGGSSFENPLAALGGADAVNDTPAIPAHGTEPEEPITGAARARVPAGSGVPVFGWILLALMVLVALAYLLGMF